MKVYCLEDFKLEFLKLSSKNSYKDLEKEIIKYFFNKKTSELMNGVRLNHSESSPYIKKRLKGSGGYRTYYLLIIKDECLYLMFVHPKTGSLGASNIDDESKAYLYKKILSSINEQDLYEVFVKSKKLIFERINKG